MGCVRGRSDGKPLLRYLLHGFIPLWRVADVPVTRLRRMSLEQCGRLIRALLGMSSGGRIPVLLVVAAFKSLIKSFQLPWELEFHGINVSDKASGAGGDLTVRSADRVILAAEVTERIIDRSRVVATFNTKISPARIEDYLFFTGNANPPADALAQVRQYFSQGHNINFVAIEAWIMSLLATLGATGRERFCQELADLVEQYLSSTLKTAWNEQIAALTRAD